MAISAGQSSVDTKPLASLLEAFFGRKHFTLRCFALSCAMSLVFTFLFVGMINAYVLDLASYLEEHRARVTVVEKHLQETFKQLSHLYDDFLIPALEKNAASSPEARRQLDEARAKSKEIEALKKTHFTTGTPLLLWMVLSVAISMNLLCDYVALGKTRVILKRTSATESPFAITAYLVLDLLLAVVIWVVSIAIFLVINRESFLAWSRETASLVVVVGMVSLATTVATSIWIYTFLAGGVVTIYLRRLISLLLRGTTGLISPKEHPFKVIGIAGSVAMTVLIIVSLLIFKWMR